MLEQDLALVTGASRGIGRAIALALGGAGAQVVGTATTAEGAAQLTAAFAPAGISGRGAVWNATDAASTEALLAELEAAGGLPDDPGQQRRHRARRVASAHEERGLGADARDQSDGGVPPVQGLPAAHDEGAPRPHHQHQLGGRRRSATPGRPITRRPRPGWSGSPSRWRARSPRATSPSTRWRRASSRPT